MESPPLLDDFPERPWISMLFCRTSIWTGWQCCRVWQALWQGNHGILVRVQLTLAEVFDNMYGWGPEHGVSFPPNLTIESIGKWGLISGFGGTVASLSDKAYELSWESSAIWIDQLTHTPGNQYQSYQKCSHHIGTSHWSVSLQTRDTTAWLWYEDDWQHLARSGNHLLKLFFCGMVIQYLCGFPKMGGSPKLWLSVIFSTKMVIHWSMIGMWIGGTSIWRWQIGCTPSAPCSTHGWWRADANRRWAWAVGVELKLGRRRVESMEHGEIWHMICCRYHMIYI
jgi:hypothetical protein